MAISNISLIPIFSRGKGFYLNALACGALVHSPRGESRRGASEEPERGLSCCTPIAIHMSNMPRHGCHGQVGDCKINVDASAC